MASTNTVAAPQGVVRHASPEWVVFGCDGRRFAVPLSRVREILLPRPFTRMPGCGPAVCGLIAHRGGILTGFDLGAALELRPAAARPDHRLLMLEQGDRLVAGAVEEVFAVARTRVRALPRWFEAPRVRGADREDVLGVGRLPQGSFVALDSDRILGRLLA